MRKLTIVAVLLAAAGVAWWRISAQPARPLAELMPEGALLYLEASDFSRLLNEWNTSKVKRDWLAGANYQVFAQSNLFTKLSGVYDEYGKAAGFTPGLENVIEIAGDESALALYDIHDVQFLYITHVPRNRLTASQLWRVRDKFEQRQAAGLPFYVRTDGSRTVAFAFANDNLFVATRDDLMAQALALSSGARQPSVAASLWYSDATKASPKRGELRLVLNFDALLKNTYFGSHWLYRNASELRQYTAGIADVTREPNQIVEDRTFLRSPDANVATIPDDARRALAELSALAPDTAGLYRTWASPSGDFAATLIERKLLAPDVHSLAPVRYAPQASSTGEVAGSETDLETRIDEPPLPADSSGALVTAPLRKLLAETHPIALMQVQSSAAMPNGFIATPCVLAIAAPSAWDANAVRESLTEAVETLWTTSRLGAHWVPATAGAHGIERLDGLAPLMMTVRDRVLFLANDADLLAAVLDRPAGATPSNSATYSAVFRHARERAPYVRLMTALDFAQSAPSPSFGFRMRNANEPAFFSGNLASLSAALSFVNTVKVTAHDRGDAVTEQVIYAIAP